MDNGTGPKIIAGVAVVLAIASSAFTFSEYNTTKDLTVQLNAATADAQSLREQLAAATADAQQARTQASTEQQLIVKEARPDLPITMGLSVIVESAHDILWADFHAIRGLIPVPLPARCRR